MVRKNKLALTRLAALVLVIGMSFGQTACTGPVFPGKEDPDSSSANAFDDDDEDGDRFGDDPGEEEDDKDPSVKQMKGPQAVPEGQAYDKYFGVEYTDQTTFELKSYWGFKMTSNKPASEYGYVCDPEAYTGTMEIVDAYAEPVGGEMKLRSGGYVDITIRAEWNGTMHGYQDGYAGTLDYVGYHEVYGTPCDAYTGTSLLNSTDTDDEGLFQGQATETRYVESDVSWKEHTFRLYASEDYKNASLSGWDVDYKGDRTIYDIPVHGIDTLSIRIPADYDGLILQIPKDVAKYKSRYMADSGEWISVSDTYADMLTNDFGEITKPDEYYFVKVSDLIEKFKDRDRENPEE